MVKGDGRPPSPLCVCSVFIGLVLRDGVQIRLYIFGFLGPLGLDSGRFTTPFLKCVSSNFSKKTNNPNPSPIKKIWFGLYWFGAGGGGRTRTVSPPRDFESRTSANSITPANCVYIIPADGTKSKQNFAHFSAAPVPGCTGMCFTER